MATKTNRDFFALKIILTFFLYVDCYLDFEELKSIHYGIDILSKPVMLGKEMPLGSIQLTSKYGQHYQCSLPDQVEHERQQEEKERVAKETGVIELLRPMEDVACLIKTRDWWSYEFCYGKHIRQFHLEEGRITGDVMIIGYYDGDFDWDNETLREEKLNTKSGLNRFHSQKYVNGSTCDLTGGMRSAEVRFVCEDIANDYIARIDEPETCGYIVTVHTNKICHHPYLKSPAPKTPIPITCNPLLDEEDYNAYLAEIAAKQQREKEAEEKEKLERLRREERIKNSQEDMRKYLRKDQTEGEDAVFTIKTDTHNVESSDKNINMKKIEKAVHKAFDKEISKIAEQTGIDTNDAELSIKMIDDVSDLESMLREQLTAAQKLKIKKLKKSTRTSDPSVGKEKEQASELHTNGQDTVSTGQESTNAVSKDEDLDEFKDDINEAKLTYQAQDQSVKDEIEDSVRSQFENIINEAEEEAGQQVDKTEAFDQLSKALDNLITSMDKTEEDLDAVNKEIHDNLNRQQDFEPKDENVVDSTSENDDPAEEQFFQPDETVRVKIKKVSSEDLKQTTNNLASSETINKIENKVKEGLEKAGFNTEGGKVQVKIITTGYYDSNDDSIHILSDDSKSSFRSVIISLMNGGQEALKEEERHKSLEDNYKRVWSKKQKKSKAMNT